MKGKSSLHTSVPLIHPTLNKKNKKIKKKPKTLHNLEVATSGEYDTQNSFLKNHELT